MTFTIPMLSNLNKDQNMLLGLLQGIMCNGTLQPEGLFLLKTWLDKYGNHRVFQNSYFTELKTVLNGSVRSSKVVVKYIPTIEAYIVELLANYERSLSVQSHIEKQIAEVNAEFDFSTEPIDFKNACFLFTGIFNNRFELEFEIEMQGGYFLKGKEITYELDYLIVGNKPEPSWKTPVAGNKIISTLQKNEKIKAGFAPRINPILICKESHVLNCLSSPPVLPLLPLLGKKYVLTGNFNYGLRYEVSNSLKLLGANVLMVVTEETTAVIAGENHGSNRGDYSVPIEDAKLLNIPVLDESAFLELLQAK